MSIRRKKKKRDKEKAPPPMTAAGLMTFYEEDIGGIKIKPEIVLLLSFALMIIVIMAHLGLFSPLVP